MSVPKNTHIFRSLRKDLEGKKISVEGFEDATSAIGVIEECIDRYKKKFCPEHEGQENN